MIPAYYEFYNPVKINAGDGALETIPYELGQMNAAKPLIITDKGVVKNGLLEIVLNAFRDSEIVIGAVYDDTPPDSSLVVVNEITALYHKSGCDSIIALGGGSSIDTAKGVNIAVSEKTNDIATFMGADRLKSTPRPFVVIPTTAGTGSEVTLVAVINDTENHVKLPFTSYRLLPNLAVLDPRMTMTLPPKITAMTGMDALTHAVEAFTCMQKNPISDAYATVAISLISKNIMSATKPNAKKETRFAMANAATMAGVAFSNSMVGAVHAIGHACGAIARVPHGMAMSILLPHVMEFNMDKLEDLYAKLLLHLTDEETYAKTFQSQRAKKAIQRIVEMRKELYDIAGLPFTLRGAGVTEEQFAKIAELAMNDGAMLPNPKILTTADVIGILKKAY